MTSALQYASPLGKIFLAADGGGIAALWFEGQAVPEAARALPCAAAPAQVLQQARLWLDQYFSGQQPEFTPLLHLTGTPFRLQVWHLLSGIPWGDTVTYGELSARIPGSSPRAVGGAVGHNPVALMVPCHRVTGAGGAMTGYAGGIWRKRRLLEMEASGKRP